MNIILPVNTIAPIIMYVVFIFSSFMDVSGDTIQLFISYVTRFILQ